MPKDHLLYLRLQEVGLASAANTFTPAPADADTLSLVHGRAYVEAFLAGCLDAKAMRRIGLPWSEKLVRRTLVGTGAAVLAARLALQYGSAVMTNGGTHHAHAHHGSGFCIFNDLAVAARAAQASLGVERVLFIDLDVHHGDGTAAIFAGDASVFTLSIHCAAQAFPAERPPSSLDIGLAAGAGDAELLDALYGSLPGALDAFAPQLVLYNAGVDPHADDSLGLLTCTDAGLAARDAFVLQQCAERGIPLAAAIGGGYSADHAAIVERHVLLHAAAAASHAKHGAAFVERRMAEAAARRRARLEAGVKA